MNRDEIIPIVDLRIRLGKSEENGQSVLLVISINDTLFGLMIDGVCNVEHIAAEEIQKLLEQGKSQPSCFMGIAKLGVGCFDFGCFHAPEWRRT